MYYGKSQALDGVSLTVERGEIGGIIGPNGAGKTTLLDAVAGFLDDDGTIPFIGETWPTSTTAVGMTVVYGTEDATCSRTPRSTERAHGRAVPRGPRCRPGRPGHGDDRSRGSTTAGIKRRRR